MSFQDYEKAMLLAPERQYYTTVGGKSEDEIQRSEQLLGVKFSPQCLDFYQKFGYMSFFGCEIFGIDPDDEELEGNSVAYALNDRQEYGLPDEWIPIFNFDDGNMAYLDYATLNDASEPRVIMAFYNGSEYEITDVLAEDFGAFILQLLEE